MEDRDYQHERALLPHRLLVFLTTSSLLFIGFVTTEKLFLQRWISIFGLVTCFVAFLHFWPIDRRLSDQEKKLKKESTRKWYEKPFSGRVIGWLWFVLIFGALWVCALLTTIFHNWL